MEFAKYDDGLFARTLLDDDTLALVGMTLNVLSVTAESRNYAQSIQAQPSEGK